MQLECSRDALLLHPVPIHRSFIWVGRQTSEFEGRSSNGKSFERIILERFIIFKESVHRALCSRGPRLGPCGCIGVRIKWCSVNQNLEMNWLNIGKHLQVDGVRQAEDLITVALNCLRICDKNNDGWELMWSVEWNRKGADYGKKCWSG